MIVPMKKIAILVQAKDSEPAIDKLRTLGVVHVEHQQLPKGANISGLTDELALIEAAAGRRPGQIGSVDQTGPVRDLEGLVP